LSEAGLAGPYRALVVGARGAIGGAFIEALAADPDCADVIGWSRGPTPAANAAKVTMRDGVELTNEASVAAAAAELPTELDLVLVASGALHGAGIQPEKSYRALEAANMAAIFAANAIGPALVAKHSLGRLPRGRRSVWAALSARVGSIGDNRLGGWHSYRASKAALNMMLRCWAIELARTAPQAVLVGLHPGTVASALSAPFQGNVAAEKLFTPAQSARFLLDALAARAPADSGGVFDWAGTPIAP